MTAAVHTMSFEDPGEVGGIFAGVVGLLIAVGKGLKWLLSWRDHRTSKRIEKLDGWEEAVHQREKAFERKIEARLEFLEKENRAYRLALLHVVPALRAINPEHPSLRLADDALRAVHQVDPIVPTDMLRDISRLDDIP